MAKDKEAWRPAVHEVAESWRRLSYGTAKDRASHGKGPTDSSWPHQHGPSSRRHLGAQWGLDGRHGRACQPKPEQRTRHGLVWFSRAVSPRKKPAFLKGIHLFVEKYKI